ncbi:MAG TPA: hypothetical protein PK997_00620 [Candidatus Omnitrophota bacterium]|jgi:hypothetical protein|nr:hypothetical protein [Candidatus Omnitrophota bacterium]HPW64712.1 hypothetical protein [Candidatus Omnitrophota bacterium]HQB93693.1 hypothetical protein [Candidatus Omnitrophota bacterium]
MSNDELRGKVVEVARKHKASWIELGQYLFSISKDRIFREWGYNTFEAYCVRELKIREATASKLLKSYSFLEREEPRMVKPEYTTEEEPRKIPDYEAVNLLRLAKQNKNIPVQEFAELRHEVLNEAREFRDVRAKVKAIVAERKPKDTPEAREAKRSSAIRRLIGFLNGAKKQLKDEDLVPDHLLRQIEALAAKLEDQLH